MPRKTFSQMLQNTGLDLNKEYDRLYELFYILKLHGEYTLYDRCAFDFHKFPYKDTCTTLFDFNKTFGFSFSPSSMVAPDIDGLVLFCEYTYNLVWFLLPSGTNSRRLIEQVNKVIEKIGYMPNSNQGLTDFVPKKREAIIAAESVDDSKISYDILEYNHHSMKGKIDEKRVALTSFANYFEQKRKVLESFNKKFSDNLFMMFNDFNIRHDNNGKNPLLEDISPEKQEEFYDITYELCLTAFSILAGTESNDKVKQLRKELGK